MKSECIECIHESGDCVNCRNSFPDDVYHKAFNDFYNSISGSFSGKTTRKLKQMMNKSLTNARKS